MDMMLMWRLTLDGTSARTSMAKNWLQPYGKDLADFIKGSVTIATEKKKFIEAAEGGRK